MKQLRETDMALLRQNFLFCGVADETVDALLDDVESPQVVKKGETVYTPECFLRALTVVLRGRLRVTGSADKHTKVILNLLHAGDLCGATAVFDDTPTFVSEITALEEAMLVRIPQAVLSGWFARCPQIAENYIRFLTGRIRFLNRKIAMYTGGEADARLWRYLCAHQEADGRVTISGSFTDLARALDVGRSSLYRSLKTLEDNGSIRREGKTIFLGDGALCP